MDDLIRRSDAYNAVFDYVGDYEPPLLESIKDIPAVDAVEVRHGQWIDDCMDYICSVCNERVDGEIVFMIDADDMPRYCPNCGARMDGGEEHNETD